MSFDNAKGITETTAPLILKWHAIKVFTTNVIYWFSDIFVFCILFLASSDNEGD